VSLTQPGRFDSVENRSAEITDFEQYLWTGLQAQATIQLHPNFVVNHILQMGKHENVDMTGHKDDERSRFDVAPFVKAGNWHLHGKVGTAGAMSSRVMYDRGKFFGIWSGQYSSDETRSGFTVECGYKFATATIEAKMQGAAFGVSLTKSIMRNWVLGSEYFYSPPNDVSRSKIVSAMGSKTGSGVFATSFATGLGSHQLNAHYMREVIKSLDVGVTSEFTFKPRERAWSSLFRAGYQYKPVESQMMVKGAVDSGGGLMMMIDEQLSEAMTAQFAAKVSYPDNTWDFGIGLNVLM